VQHGPVRLDILAGVRVVPEPLDVLADVSGTVREATIKIGNGNAQALGKESGDSALAGSSRTDESDREGTGFHNIHA